jgi:hypothetical protein
MAEQATASYEKVDRKAEVMDTRMIAGLCEDRCSARVSSNLYSIPLKWWDRVAGSTSCWTARVTSMMLMCAIPPGKVSTRSGTSTTLIYVLDGRGATTVWQTNGAKQSFEWQTGAYSQSL